MSFTVDCTFPGGNIIVERVEGDTVFLHQDLRDTTTDWFYWCFRVRGAAGRIVRFRFTEANVIGVRGPGVSLDRGRTWTWLGTAAVEDRSFVYTFPPDADEVRFSFGMAYLQEHMDRFLNGHRGHPCLRRETLCVTRKGRKAELLLFAPRRGGTKFRLLVTARHHCCEMMASYALEGLLGVALAGDAEGAWFRDNVAIAAVPFVDRDGVEDGDQGKNRNPRDHNRDYDPPHAHLETAALDNFVKRWGDTRPDLGLDLHCPHICGKWNEQIYCVGSEDPANQVCERRFVATLAGVRQGALPFDAASGYLPYGEAWNTGANFSQGKGFKSWLLGMPGTGGVCTFEIPYANAGGVEVTADSARAFGRDLAHAVKKYLEGVGA
ncbi:MAG: peptidase M14 [Planctomycetota bacterium]